MSGAGCLVRARAGARAGARGRARVTGRGRVRARLRLRLRVTRRGRRVPLRRSKVAIASCSAATQLLGSVLGLGVDLGLGAACFRIRPSP